MFYYLIYSLRTKYSFLNVFRYITFRAAYTALTSLILSFLLGPWLINKLRSFNVGEQIRDVVPVVHQTKAGTPTMGGILLLISLVIPTLLWADLKNRYIWVVILVTVSFGILGFWDDFLKLKGKGKSSGLSIKSKLLIQSLIALAAGIYLYLNPANSYTTELAVPFFKNLKPNLGWFYIPFCLFVIVGTSNSVNLTDGLDGLAIGPMIIAAATYTGLAYVTGHAKFAHYLMIINVKGAGELTIFCSAMMGAGLGFLWFNTYPAQVFMGDMGSLSLGAALGTVALLTKHELILILIGGLFVIETVSVIIQIISFRLSGRRIFAMAPIHHHFELKGWAEPKIIVRFWIISIILALLSFSTLKLR
ncbi:MAG: phospho-N-acetylmuramoyl-pentapeptide-transferase [bacterium]